MTQKKNFVKGFNEIFNRENRKSEEYSKAFDNLIRALNDAQEYDDITFYVNDKLADTTKRFIERVIARYEWSLIQLATTDVDIQTYRATPDSFAYETGTDTITFFDKSDFYDYVQAIGGANRLYDVLEPMIEETRYFEDEIKAKDDLIQFLEEVKENSYIPYEDAQENKYFTRNLLDFFDARDKVTTLSYSLEYDSGLFKF